jgi:hypothetical protein
VGQRIIRLQVERARTARLPEHIPAERSGRSRRSPTSFRREGIERTASGDTVCDNIRRGHEKADAVSQEGDVITIRE